MTKRDYPKMKKRKLVKGDGNSQKNQKSKLPEQTPPRRSVRVGSSPMKKTTEKKTEAESSRSKKKSPANRTPNAKRRRASDGEESDSYCDVNQRQENLIQVS